MRCDRKPEMGPAVTALGRTVYEDGPSGPLFGGGVREEYRVKLASRRLLTRGSGE